jgi:hypothetical protein
VETWQGKRVRIVEFQYNTLSFHTGVLWVPAFWFMEHVYGYQPGGYAAMFEHSIQLYAKFL